MVAKFNSGKFLSALLVSTAFTVPAFAQIETVVVTAERKAEDIQTVPIAVTALTGADLKSKQVNSFRDLQFHVPSVTYTKSNFGGAQFQIRGITTQFGLGAAIAQNENDIYIEAPNLVTGQYYDVDRVEVSRGPQSTSYGRAATGGAVNIITSKPDLDEFLARASFDYGTFNTMKPEVDGQHSDHRRRTWVFGSPPSASSTMATKRTCTTGRKSSRAVQSTKTSTARARLPAAPRSAGSRAPTRRSIYVGTSIGYENDNRVRGDKQECHRDPSGVVGCFPDRLGFDPPNLNSTLGATLGFEAGRRRAAQHDSRLRVSTLSHSGAAAWQCPWAL